MAKNKGKKKGLIIVIVIAVLLVLIVGGSIAGGIIAGNNSGVVTTVKVKKGVVDQKIMNSGVIESDEKVYYYAPGSLTIGKLVVKAGDKVKKGDLLFTYEDTTLNDAIRENELNIVICEAGYNDKDTSNKENTSDYTNYTYKVNNLKAEIAQYESYIDLLNEDMTNGDKQESRNYIIRIEMYNEQNASLQQKISDLSSQLTGKAAADKSKEDLEKIEEEVEKLEKEVYNNNLAVSQLQTAQTLSAYNPTSDDEKSLKNAQEHLADLKEELAEAESKKAAAEAGKLNEYGISQLEADNEIQMIKLTRQKEALDAVKNGVVAQADGVVSSMDIYEGQNVLEGTTVLVLSSTEKVSLTTSLGKGDLKIAEVGQSATVTLLGTEYEGKVSHIDQIAMAQSGSTTTSIGCQISIDNPEGIILGLDGKVSILANHKEDALLVPTEAVNTDRTGDFLYLVEDGIAKKTYVTTGISSSTEIEILEGVKEGDEVISMVTIDIADGIPVKTVDVSSAAEDIEGDN